MTVRAENLALRAEVRPQSVNDKARTVELLASTGSAVERFDPQGPFIEQLEISAQAVDLSRLDGMPLLDSHRQDGLERVLGVVRSAKIEGGHLILTVEFSERAEAIWKDVKAGIIRNVSVGYHVTKWADGSAKTNGIRMRTATKWTPFEVSIVPVGADPKAKARGMNMDPVQTTETTTLPAPGARKEINVQIRSMAKTMGLGADFYDPLIDDEATLEQAQTAAIEKVGATRMAAPTSRSTVVFSNDDPTIVARRIGEATYAVRANPKHELSQEARPYVGMTMLDIARQCLQMRGHSSTGMTPAEVFTRAGMHTTSDFPIVMEETARRTLRDGYAMVPSTLKAMAKQTTAVDFRAKTTVQMDDTVKLEKVSEAGEYKYGSFVEGKESYKIDTFGKILAVSRQLLINDDLGAFTNLATNMGRAAAEFEADFLTDLLMSNAGLGPVMGDGKTLFHADHGNIGVASNPSAMAIEAAFDAMGKIKGLNGRLIGITPRYALSGAHRFLMDQLLATIAPAKTEDVNTLAGKLSNAVEPRIPGNAWYLAADPANYPGLEYAYLAGEEGPQVFSRDGFNIDGVEVKVRLDFGAGFTDYRGWYRNAGI